MTASSFRMSILIAASAFALAVTLPALRRGQPEPDGGQAEGGNVAEAAKAAKKKKATEEKRNPSSSSSTATRPRMR